MCGATAASTIWLLWPTDRRLRYGPQTWRFLSDWVSSCALKVDSTKRLAAGRRRRHERAEGRRRGRTEEPAGGANPERARKPAQSDGTAGSLACPQAALGCDYVGSQAGVNAHQRFCEYRRNGRRNEPLPAGAGQRFA